ncbi:MAG: penicillin-binding protein 2 [Candidatus Petromonas sp.]|jgi:penicillin-binding protein 2|nr:penicillin-binding protein 2 [Candidatus Petromonas sp.]
MLEKLKDRNNQIIVSFMIIFIILLFRLATLTIVEGEKYRELSENRMKKTIPIIAKRGEIRDRDGKLLAGSIPGFTVQLVRNDLEGKKLNEIAIKIIDILESKGEEHIDFPIIIENYDYYYSYDKEIEAWLKAKGYEDLKDAEAVFSKIVAEQNIPIENLDVYKAQEILSYMGITPPISVRLMKFLPEIEKENFLKSYGLKTDISAKEAFKRIKEKFDISDDYSEEDARKIMIIRHALREQGYKKYEPLKIASNVSKETAILIEEMGMELPGISVYIEPVRYYPNGELAAHILGYLGKISSEAEVKKYVEENGYSKNDIIGKTGVEGEYELALSGKNGSKSVEVDAYGRTVKELDYIEKPKPGKDVYLTIDFELQKVAEESLKHALEEIQKGGTFKSKWGDYNYSERFEHAKAGAVVAVDVKTGEILAMANYPSYQPNLFVTGISSKDWQSLQPENKRDPIAPRPLYNIAALTAVQPGSTFKMITGLAALEQGLDPNKKFYDGGYIKIGNKSFGSWMWNLYRRSHGYVDLYKALEESVNYYFYNLANGKDYYKNKPLDIDINIDVVLEYAKKFGLDEKTGIEIGEVAYGIPDPDRKYRTIRSLLERKLTSIAKDYFTQEILSSKQKLNQSIQKILSWADDNPSRVQLIRRLKDIGVIESKTEELADLVKYSYYNQMNFDEFREGDAFNLAIGQGSHAYTPLQMARYISAIANGGYLNELSIVKKVGDNTVSKKDKRKKIDLKDSSNLEDIKKGMLQVTQGDKGTARGVFKDFPVLVGAKTGTAERHGKIPPKNEVEYLEKNFEKIIKNAPHLTLDMVEKEAARILKSRREELAKLEADGKTETVINKIRWGYIDKGEIMREAIKKLSKNRISDEEIDAFKDDYDNFAWFVSFAPYDNPQIAVVTLLFQGGHGGYGAPIAREVIAEYLGLNKETENQTQDKLKQ